METRDMRPDRFFCFIDRSEIDMTSLGGERDETRVRFDERRQPKTSAGPHDQLRPPIWRPRGADRQRVARADNRERQRLRLEIIEKQALRQIETLSYGGSVEPPGS